MCAFPHVRISQLHRQEPGADPRTSTYRAGVLYEDGVGFTPCRSAIITHGEADRHFGVPSDCGSQSARDRAAVPASLSSPAGDRDGDAGFGGWQSLQRDPRDRTLRTVATTISRAAFGSLTRSACAPRTAAGMQTRPRPRASPPAPVNLWGTPVAVAERLRRKAKRHFVPHSRRATPRGRRLSKVAALAATRPFELIGCDPSVNVVRTFLHRRSASASVAPVVPGRCDYDRHSGPAVSVSETPEAPEVYRHPSRSLRQSSARSSFESFSRDHGVIRGPHS